VAGAGVRRAARRDAHPHEAGDGEDPDVVVEGLAKGEAVKAAVVIDVVAGAVGGGGDDGAALRPSCGVRAAGGVLRVPGM
jgi:hypothetical protein